MKTHQSKESNSGNTDSVTLYIQTNDTDDKMRICSTSTVSADLDFILEKKSLFKTSKARPQSISKKVVRKERVISKLK